MPLHVGAAPARPRTARHHQVTLRAPLKQFHLKDCKLLDVTKSKDDAKEEDGAALVLAAALSALPHLESLSIDSLRTRNGIMRFRMTVLSKLQQLTSLRITHTKLPVSDEVIYLVPPLKALTRLVELRVDFSAKYYVSTDALSTLEHLTILALAAETDYMVYLEGAGLAGMTNLRILDLASCIGTGVSTSPGRCGGYGDEYILQYLPQLQQLRHLHMRGSLHGQSPYSTMMAAAYSALTSSRALQSLSLTNCKVPPGVWQHMFSTGKQITSLTSLDLDGVVQRSEGLQPEGGRQVVYSLAAAPTGTCLAGCCLLHCPSLQIVNMHNLECTAEGLASLQGLGSLRQLVVQPAMPADSQSDLKVFQALCQLTQLRCLVLYDKVPEGLLPLQLTQLQGLTVLANAQTTGQGA